MLILLMVKGFISLLFSNLSFADRVLVSGVTDGGESNAPPGSSDVGPFFEMGLP